MMKEKTDGNMCKSETSAVQGFSFSCPAFQNIAARVLTSHGRANDATGVKYITT